MTIPNLFLKGSTSTNKFWSSNFLSSGIKNHNHLLSKDVKYQFPLVVYVSNQQISKHLLAHMSSFFYSQHPQPDLTNDLLYLPTKQPEILDFIIHLCVKIHLFIKNNEDNKV
ncbi:hypothetical protein OIU74_000092 [Salix koriyanagi]|uniref:Uncharacterized protein n=1 Tax=Salix koriyanagi TaxID=2511006 RepID=A0A9Q0WZ13_9ROSI|nr:hypothetical protein OIU74_000092 [Salix koriyanagi]